MDKAALLALADRVEATKKSDNSLDVLCEIALFKPNTIVVSVRANRTKTKVIYKDIYGKECTQWANDWTIAHLRNATAAALRAIAEGCE